MVTIAANRAAITALAAKEGEMALALDKRQVYISVEAATTPDEVSVLTHAVDGFVWLAVTHPLPVLDGNGGKGVRVKADATQLEFYALA